MNKLIKEDRNCNIESRPKIKIISKILYDLDLSFPKIKKDENKIFWISKKETENKNVETKYQDKWYENFLKYETINFIKEKANNDIHNMTAPKYILSSLKYINEEYIREKLYINSKYHNKINEINYKYLIEDNAQILSKMNTGISYMFKNKRNDELTKAFQLFKLCPKSLDVIIEEFQSYIINRVKEINENKEPKKFISELICFKKEIDNLIVDCFENHPKFEDKKNKTFSLFTDKDLKVEVKEEKLEETQNTKRYQDNILKITLITIMKSRIGQVTSHTILMNETEKLIDLFKAEQQQIEENIKRLIEKNIIKRSEKDMNCYEFIE